MTAGAPASVAFMSPALPTGIAGCLCIFSSAKFRPFFEYPTFTDRQHCMPAGGGPSMPIPDIRAPSGSTPGRGRGRPRTAHACSSVAGCAMNSVSESVTGSREHPGRMTAFTPKASAAVAAKRMTSTATARTRPALLTSASPATSPVRLANATRGQGARTSTRAHMAAPNAVRDRSRASPPRGSRRPRPA